MKRRALSTILTTILATAPLSGCGQSAPNIPEIPKDICAKTGKTLSREEKIVAALVKLYEIRKESYASDNLSLSDYVKQNAKSQSIYNIRISARSFYKKYPNCCELREPWPITELREIGRRKPDGSEGDDSYWPASNWHMKHAKYNISWVNDVRVFDLDTPILTDNPTNFSSDDVEIGSCGETSLRDRG
jgi:hypothetical protein